MLVLCTATLILKPIDLRNNQSSEGMARAARKLAPETEKERTKRRAMARMGGMRA